MFQSSLQSSSLIKAIRSQTDGVPADLVYVIDILSVRFGGHFTNDIVEQLQKYRQLQMLTLNDCGIVSLRNFPYLPNLIRLDLVMNQIKGEQLGFLKGSRHIQTLMLGANKICTFQELEQLNFMKNLLQLDLINNPVTFQAGYRQIVFKMFPKLSILDTLDLGGKDAFNNVTMKDAIDRVPDHLFSREPSFVGIHHHQRDHLNMALMRKGSLSWGGARAVGVGSVQTKGVSLADRNVDKSKKAKSRTKAGLTFPVARLKRMLKSNDNTGIRIKKTTAVFMAAVLEYLVGQLLEMAGQQTKNQRKSRITPLILKDCLAPQSEISKLFKYTTLGTMGE